MESELLANSLQPHALAVLLLTLLALILFANDRIPLQTSSLFVICALVLGFHIFPYQQTDGSVFPIKTFFLGFGNEALIAVCALMVAGQALVRTGAMEPIGRYLAKIWKVSPSLSLLLTLITGAILSAFVNNTPIVVLLLPVLISVSLRTGQSTAGTLMPMGLATLLGGMATTIGTSTNLLVVKVAEGLGVPEFGMFDFVFPVSIAAVVAILYLWLIAPLILPDRTPPLKDTSPRVFSAEIKVDEGAFADGKTLAEIRNKVDGKINIQRIVRGDSLSIATLPDVIIKANDRLIVSDTADNLREYEIELGGSLFTGDHQVDESHPLSAGDQSIAELVITSGSLLDRVRVGDSRLTSKYGLTLLAVHSQGKETAATAKGMDDVIFRPGDVLLVQGTHEAIQEVKRAGSLLVLDGGEELPHTKKAPLALAVMAGVVGLAAFNVMPISISAIIGCFVLIATGCLRWRDATHALSAQVIFIIVASLALGAALMATGGADYLANLFVASTDGFAPGVVLGILMFSMAIMTNVISNNAAAVIGTPISVSIAQSLGMPVEPFVLAVLFGANLSYATPMAYQTNLLVMNAGGYKFADFVKVGVPLTIIVWAMLTGMLTWIYKLY
ncbi:SLC13 family permease [Marinicella sp. S1101]|uniref:SLC13 family permease n=1 Tax=Marinicella marina TaxID=2996016 RepID=UPI002260DB55|nr:SLC13 family permease [Marinicella marina]MCX7553554.1 SLC13 family permease [Marinicella marina]MDJ1140178.1 SLC13 family permease [Marinicella marina]